MAITVGTNSYVTEAELTAYATDRGITISNDTSVLLIKAMDYIETRMYISSKYDTAQALQFPRWSILDYDDDVVPTEIKNAQMIAALLIDSGKDLQPTIGQSVKREKVDVIEVEYQDGSTTGSNQFRALNDILRPFLYPTNRGIRV